MKTNLNNSYLNKIIMHLHPARTKPDEIFLTYSYRILSISKQSNHIYINFNVFMPLTQPLSQSNRLI